MDPGPILIVALEIALHGIGKRLAVNLRRNYRSRGWRRSWDDSHALFERINAARQHLPKFERTFARRRKIDFRMRAESNIVGFASSGVPKQKRLAVAACPQIKP